MSSVFGFTDVLEEVLVVSSILVVDTAHTVRFDGCFSHVKMEMGRDPP